jgi:hypothetical protein
MTSYELIPVNPVNGDYDGDYNSACWTFGGGGRAAGAWHALAGLLAGRDVWHFDVDIANQQVLWACGVPGEANLTIFVDEDNRYYCHDHLADEKNDPNPDTACEDIQAVEAWISPREAAAWKLSALGQQYALLLREAPPPEQG